jgi:hypothetical protein
MGTYRNLTAFLKKGTDKLLRFEITIRKSKNIVILALHPGSFS